jgi:hypothetical protein
MVPRFFYGFVTRRCKGNGLRFWRRERKWFERKELLRHSRCEFFALRRVTVRMRETNGIVEQLRREIDIFAINLASIAHITERVEVADKIPARGAQPKFVSIRPFASRFLVCF